MTIVGAGVAGLTIAYQLVRQGFHVTVIEKNAVVGGLARTFHYGDFHFDVGPHRFHTENSRVAEFIRRILGKEAIEIPRKSGARMFGRFHEWPLRPGILLSMPFSLMLRAARDLLFKEHLPGESFEADIVNTYGRTLYDIFFKPYTRKFLFHSPAVLHRDWARAGVNRAVIDKRAQSDSLWGLLKTTLMPKPVETMFLYPPHGVGRFSDLLAEGVRQVGGRILTDTTVTAVETARNRVTAVRTQTERIPCDNIVWTAPLTTLNHLVGIDDVDLEYLSTIFYNVEVAKPPKLDYQWTYFGGDEIFSRVTAPQAFLTSTTPPGKGGLCVELTCREGDERWRNPESYVSRIVADLVRTGAVESAGGRGAGAHRVRAFHISDLQVELSLRADPEPESTVQLPQSPARRPLRTLLVQQHGPLHRAGADHGGQDSPWRDAGRDRQRGSRVLDRRGRRREPRRRS